MRLCVVLLFGQGVFSARECIIASKRIQWVLELPEDIDSCITKKACTSADSPDSNFTASWRGTKEAITSNKYVLKSIELTLDCRQLVVIAGPVGSGKSSLLLSLVNELPGLSGQLTVTGKLSYASQEPWIFSGTIRDNILFSNPLDPERYWNVIAACCLREDIDSYPDRDMTLIGERGVTLSGGQKARVSLARSVYYQADIYLFDDPLSAVEVFDNCMKALLRDKMILLVTHHIHYVRQADSVVVMREGEIVSSGTFREAVQRCEFCRDFLQGLEESDKMPQLVGDCISNTNGHAATKVSNVQDSTENPAIIESEPSNSKSLHCPHN